MSAYEVNRGGWAKLILDHGQQDRLEALQPIANSDGHLWGRR